MSRPSLARTLAISLIALKGLRICSSTNKQMTQLKKLSSTGMFSTIPLRYFFTPIDGTASGESMNELNPLVSKCSDIDCPPISSIFEPWGSPLIISISSLSKSPKLDKGRLKFPSKGERYEYVLASQGAISASDVARGTGNVWSWLFFFMIPAATPAGCHAESLSHSDDRVATSQP